MNARRPRRSVAVGIALGAAIVATAACQSVPADPSVSGLPATPARSAPVSADPTPPGTQTVGTFVAPVEACAGQKPWTGVPAIVIRYADAWHDHDFAKRRAILDEVWAGDGVFQDPYSDAVVGRDGLAAVMGYGVAPSQYLELRTWHPSDMQQGAIRLEWRHCCPSGISLLEGVDLVTLGPDGRISRVVQFWSRYVEEAAEVACDGPRLTSAPSAAPAAASCNGPDVDWSALPPVAQGYGKAWNERDPAVRRALLDEVWAEHGTFADQTVATPVAGREAFDEHLAAFLQAGFGEYFELRPIAGGDVHHGHIRIPWTYCDAAGNVVWIGDDIVELDADGRIARVLSFFVL